MYPVINTRHYAAPAVVIVIYMAHLEVRLAVDKPRASPLFGEDSGCVNSADKGAENNGMLVRYLINCNRNSTESWFDNP